MELGIQRFSFQFIKSHRYLHFTSCVCVWNESIKTGGKECRQCVGVYVCVVQGVV